MRVTFPNHEEVKINATGKYNIEEALYEHENYPSDFDDDSEQEEASVDQNELTQIMENYQELLQQEAGKTLTTLGASSKAEAQF